MVGRQANACTRYEQGSKDAFFAKTKQKLQQGGYSLKSRRFLAF
jgi:hypothetical protein